jgi:5-methylcytosine-specific restriction endonuclease McrBC regulatory subunit McrC
LQNLLFAKEKNTDRRMEAIPDECFFQNAKLKLVIDAKYKGDAYQDTLRPVSSDVYQVLTAARAADAEKCMLVYPGRPQASMEKWDVKGTGNPRHLYLVSIDPILLSERDGIGQVSSHIEDSIETALSS